MTVQCAAGRVRQYDTKWLFSENHLQEGREFKDQGTNAGAAKLLLLYDIVQAPSEQWQQSVGVSLAPPMPQRSLDGLRFVRGLESGGPQDHAGWRM